MVLDGGRELRPRHQPSAATGNLLFRGCQRSPDQAWPSVFEIDPSCVPALSTSLVVSATRTSQSPQNGPPTDQSIELPGRTGHRWRDRTSSQLACRVRGVPTKDVSGRAYTPADTGGAGPVGGLLSLLSLLARSPPRSSSRARILTGRAYSEISCWRTRPDCGVRLRFHRPSRGSGIPWSVRRGSFGAQAGPLRLGEAHLLPGHRQPQYASRQPQWDPSSSGCHWWPIASWFWARPADVADPTPSASGAYRISASPCAERWIRRPHGVGRRPGARHAAALRLCGGNRRCPQQSSRSASGPVGLHPPDEALPVAISPASAGAYLAGRLSTSRGVQEPSRPAAIKAATVASDALRLALIDQVDQQAWMSRADVPLLGRPQAPAGQGMSGGWLPTWHPTIRPMTPPAGKSGARPHSVGVHGF